MSMLRSASLFLLAIISVLGAPDPALPPELRGVLVTGRERHFALASAGGGHSGWASLGESFDGWKLVACPMSGDALVLARGGQQVTVSLNSSVTQHADADGNGSRQATVAEVDEMLTKMKFDAMWDRIVAEQRKSIAGAIRQQAAPEFAKQGLPAQEIDALIEKMGDAVVAGIQPDVMRQDFARIFAEVYSADELRGMANFYDTATGKAWAAKQPEVQQKLMQSMMPRVMQGMPAAQKVAEDYFRQRAAASQPRK